MNRAFFYIVRTMLFLALSHVSLHSQSGQTKTPRKAQQSKPPAAPKVQKDQPLEPHEIAELLRKSLVVIETQNKDGKRLALGSGFFIGENTIVTNLHVFQWAYTATAKVVQSSERVNIFRIQIMDRQHDLCTFTVNYEGTPVKFASKMPRVGDRIYALGNPLGLEATFSAGMVSAIRGAEIQMDAPISHGSSGGPVANDHGEVIGVSSSYVEGGQNLNFVIRLDSLGFDVENLPIDVVGRLALTDLEYEHLSGAVKEIKVWESKHDENGDREPAQLISRRRYDQGGNLVENCSYTNGKLDTCTAFLRGDDTFVTQSRKSTGTTRHPTITYSREEALDLELNSRRIRTELPGNRYTSVYDDFGDVIELRRGALWQRAAHTANPDFSPNNASIPLGGLSLFGHSNTNSTPSAIGSSRCRRSLPQRSKQVLDT